MLADSKKGRDLVQIEVAAGQSVTAATHFDARPQIVRNAPAWVGKTRAMHDISGLQSYLQKRMVKIQREKI